MTTANLKTNEYNQYYHNFIEILGNVSIIEAFTDGLKTVEALPHLVSEALANKTYAEGKWTVKDIILHLIDVERVFSYRALCIARGDISNLPGFDQDLFVNKGEANTRTLTSLIEEYIIVRKATISLFESFNEEALKLIGTASDSRISVRALGFIISGHQKHHFEVINTHYLHL